MKPHGLILAGGEARRFGGVDKTLLRLGGTPILARLVERLGPQVSGLTLNLNGDPARVEAFGIFVVADHVEDRGAGPLAGILTGLDHVAARHGERALVLTVPGDVPFPPHDLGQRLMAALRARAVVAYALYDDRAHPLCALWRVALRHDLRVALCSEGVRSVRCFLARHATVQVEWAPQPHNPFLNLNTPEDLAEAEDLLKTDM